VLRLIPEHYGQCSTHPFVFEIIFLLTYEPNLHVD
jgi:hypothetical protein